MLKQEIIFLLTKNNIEIWRDIVGWEGYYKISNLGRVRYKNGNVRNIGTLNNSGYLMVTLKSKESNNKTQTKTVHRLVAESFLNGFSKELDVCHKDDDKTNNIVTNLKMDTHINNCNEGIRNKKLRDINLGRIGKLNSRSIPVYCVELDRVFESMNLAILFMKEKYGIPCNLRKEKLNTNKTAGGFHWKSV